MTKKVGRNDPCPCGSGKKYKKCCEQKLGGKRKFEATVISSGSSVKDKASQISTNFFNRPAPLPPPPIKKPSEGDPKHPPEADLPM